MKPRINETYNYFDDGKIKESRRSEVTVRAIVPFAEMSKEVIKYWEGEVELCNWLYAKEADFFVRAETSDGEEKIFARSLNGGWFSFGAFMDEGRLDVDGTLTAMLNQG